MEFEIRLHRIRDEPFSADAVHRHVDRLRDLDEAGRLIAAGPLGDGSGGLVLARFDSLEHAQAWVDADAFVTDGIEAAEVRPWVSAHRRNGYLTGVPTRSREFIPLPFDKHAWHPSPLPGQVVLVTTVDAHGNVDIAPKSWVSMAAFRGPIIGFGCNRDHDTYRNIGAVGEFVINVPDASLAELIWAMPATHGRRRLDDARLTTLDSEMVAPPSIAECSAHLECRLHSITEFDDGEVFMFGTIIAGRIDRHCAGSRTCRRLPPPRPDLLSRGQLLCVHGRGRDRRGSRT